MEAGLSVGGALLVAGIAGTFLAIGAWSSHSFGSFNPVEGLRYVVPAITAIVVGCQIILASFFLSVLGLKRK